MLGAAGAADGPEMPRRRLQIHGSWMFGTPRLPEELTSLVAADSAPRDRIPEDELMPRRIDGSGGELGDPTGP